jgi:hypothetical protein
MGSGFETIEYWTRFYHIYKDGNEQYKKQNTVEADLICPKDKQHYDK